MKCTKIYLDLVVILDNIYLASKLIFFFFTLTPCLFDCFIACSLSRFSVLHKGNDTCH